MKPRLNSGIYFYCILNFLSSFSGVCEYVPRISTYLSNTLNARVTDLDVGKLSETKETKVCCTPAIKNVRSKAFTTPAASPWSPVGSELLFFFFLTLTKTVSLFKSKLKYIPSKELFLTSAFKYWD